MITSKPQYSSRYSEKRRPAFLEEETSWRASVALNLPQADSHIAIAYWRDVARHEGTYCAPILDSHYTIEVLLRSTIVECFRNGQRVSKGTFSIGGTQIASPGERIEMKFQKPVEAIHFFVPRSIVATTYEEIKKTQCPPRFQIIDPAYKADFIMGKLAGILMDGNAFRSPFASLFHKSLAMAALARALEPREGRPDGRERRGLAQWRLERTIRFIEDNLGEHITLVDMAEHAGLSRMHFAAQFRLAAGLSPHHFLTMKRLEMAKTLLLEGRLSIVQIAFTVGFSSQAHFTTMFHKTYGLSPGMWRRQAAGNPIDDLYDGLDDA